MSERAVRVLLADDQRLVREAFAALLARLPRVELVGAVGSGEDAVRATATTHPDVALIDLVMPGIGGIEATRRIRAASPETRVIALTVYADDEHVFAALEAGARGYLTKDSGVDDVQRAVDTVAGGDAVLDARVQRFVVDAVSAGHAKRRRPRDELSAREREILRLVARGLSNAEIAHELVVSEATVKRHLHNIFAKTDVRDRAQAVAFAFRNGLAG